MFQNGAQYQFLDAWNYNYKCLVRPERGTMAVELTGNMLVLAIHKRPLQSASGH